MRKARLALGVWIAWMGGTLVMLIMPKLSVGPLIMTGITAAVSFVGIMIALAVAGLFE